MRPDIDGQAERSNEREHMSQRGREPVSNDWEGISQNFRSSDVGCGKADSFSLLRRPFSHAVCETYQIGLTRKTLKLFRKPRRSSSNSFGCGGMSQFSRKCARTSALAGSRSCRDNSPVFQHWVFDDIKTSSPGRDDRIPRASIDSSYPQIAQRFNAGL